MPMLPTRTRAVVLPLLAASFAAAPAAGQSALRVDLPDGPFTAGFRTVALADSSRGWGDPPVAGEPRPVAALVWYPAEAGRRAQRMRFREYARLWTVPGELPCRARECAAGAEREFLRIWSSLSDSARVVREMGARTRAVRDARPAGGRFPLVVYGPSLNAPAFENHLLAEWLASRGYVVVASHSWGADGWMTADSAGLEAQVRDMEFLLGWAESLPQVDASRVAFMGFSWGGMASVAAAGRNPRVRAVVSLDGSIRYFSRRFERFPHLHPDRLTVPALFLHGYAPPPDAVAAGSGGEDEVGEDPSFVYFGRLRHSDAMVVTFPALRHQNFNVIFPALVGTSRPSLSADPAVASAGVERIARYTGAFLDAVLKDDAAGRAFLEAPPEAHGIPPGEAVVERKTALPRGPGA